MEHDDKRRDDAATVSGLNAARTTKDVTSARLPSRPKAPWHCTARPVLSLWDRWRLVFGVPLYVRFVSPDGQCSSACSLATVVQRHWPDETWPDELQRWTSNRPGIILGPLVRPVLCDCEASAAAGAPYTSCGRGQS